VTAATKATSRQLTRRWCGMCDGDLVAATAGERGLGALKSEWGQSQCEVKKRTALGLLPYLVNYFGQTQIHGPQSIDNKGFPKECFLSENSINSINIFDGILFAENFRWKLILFRRKWFRWKNSVSKNVIFLVVSELIKYTLALNITLHHTNVHYVWYF